MTTMKNFLKFKTRQNSSDQRKFGEEFYLREAKLWRPFRLFGIFSTLSAMTLTVTAILNGQWIYGDGEWLVLYWPSGKPLPFECQKIAKNLPFKNKLPKIVFFLNCHWNKCQGFGNFFDIQMAIFRKVMFCITFV